MPDTIAARPSRRRLATLVAIAAVTIGLATTSASAPANAGVHYTKTTVKPTAATIKGTGQMKAKATGRYGNLGVASFNVLGTNPAWKQAADVRRITRDSRVALIGFQESTAIGRYLKALPSGWSSWQTPVNYNGREVAIAWRTTRLSLISAKVVKAHGSLSEIARRPGRMDQAFPGRFTTEAVFTERRSGAKLTFINGHTNQYTEAYQKGRPGLAYDNHNAREARVHFSKIRSMIRAASTRYVVVTGDFNWDFVADKRHWTSGFVLSALNSSALSSYQSLGLGRLPKTHPETGRYIDYVMLSRHSRAGFRYHNVLSGYHSDHKPLLATIALN